ncbi:MAG: ANTAR domain-containing protein [Rhodocyclaceae bacterium]|nr:ANTAR domain-containing protein [Rhodocyclaceae bacterium]
MRTSRSGNTPELLKDLRTLKAAVFHPQDNDGESLTRQLQRIGCQTQAYWPPPQELPEAVDVVFLAVNPESIRLDLPWTRAETAPTLVAVVNYENPTVVDGMLKLGASAVLAAPIRSFGVLSALVLARQVSGELRRERKRVEKLESKLRSMRQVADAKQILMKTRDISEEAAYSIMRDQAMAKRVPVEEIAVAIVNANEILSASGPKPRK